MVVVIIPCYKVKNQILQVLFGIGPEVDKIFIIDDACPEKTGEYVKQNNHDQRVEVIIHEKNLGVGGAVKTGYSKTLGMSSATVVKMDGDGQMDPGLIKKLIAPIVNGNADYVKGNRFYNLSYLRKMPLIRKLGNSFLSFVNKMVSGYWNIMDPTNGFTAINSEILKNLPLDKIDNRFFFECDMLFRLNTIRAVVHDFPMQSVYNKEKSNLRIWNIIFLWPLKYLKRFIKRIFYNYFLRDFNIGSLELIVATILLGFGVVFGLLHWIQSSETNEPATAGTVILAAVPVILGFQSLLAFIHFDVSNVPQKPVSGLI